jgi:hypothetical protein
LLSTALKRRRERSCVGRVLEHYGLLDAAIPTIALSYPLDGVGRHPPI